MSEDVVRRLEAAQELAGAFMERMDWDRLAAGRDIGLAVALFLRRHPWALLAAGATLTALGVYAIMREAAAQRAEEERMLLEPARGGNGST